MPSTSTPLCSGSPVNPSDANNSPLDKHTASPHYSPKIQHSSLVDNLRQPQLSVSPQAFSMFLVKAIEKILAERETRKSQNAALRKACEDALKILNEYSQNGANALSSSNGVAAVNHLPPPPSDSGSLLADEKLLRPFLLACSMKSAKVVITAVDSLQKLIAYGHVPNEAVGTNGDARIIEQIVTKICSCFQGVHTDDGIQLQVLKALLTVVTSSVVEVHEADILLVVRTCYNIFMATKNPINQATARATLTQIISIIFQRMEQNAVEAAVALSSMNGSINVSTPDDSNSSDPEHQMNVTPITDTAVSKNVNDLAGNTESVDNIQGVDSPDTIVLSVLNELIDNCLSTENERNRTSVKEPSNHTQRKSSIALDSSNDVPDGKNGTEAISQPAAVAMAHVTQKDAFLVFRSLCLLATKEFGGSRSAEAKSTAIRSKTLSLQLLLSLFQQPGPVFLSSDIFIAAIKQYLCVALIKNGVSPAQDVCELAVTIFLLLLVHFKPHLKRQIEVFLKDVFLEILESPTSSFEHKWIVIEALRQVCADAQCVVDIYLNYDCDINMANLFEGLTTSLAKIAQGRNSSDQTNTTSFAQRQALRTSGLECLVLILRCMVDWSQELYISPEFHSLLGAEPVGPTDSTTESTPGNAQCSSTPLSKPVDDPEAFESRKAQKEIYVSGIDLFNKGRAVQGLQLLQQHGLIGDTVDAVAELLRTEDRLCKEHVGDFLGENDPLNLHVMYAYVDQFDFAGKDFVTSMREFLSGFRLPGEAQKIDRLMEKFAARYCACNPNAGLFASADTAYVLAFSIIMLTTDLHSNQIKAHHRMTKEDYIRMNRGINESQDLPESYLGQIYDEIASCGIKLRSGDAVSRLTGARSLGSEAGSTLPHSSTPGNGQAESGIPIDWTHSDFTSATHCEHVRPMFKLAWTPFLAAFSVGLQNSDALDVAHLCLEGIRYAIRIACIFHMEMERDAYVQALARFTLLLTSSASGSTSGSSAGNTAASRRPRSEIVPLTSSNLNPGSLSSTGVTPTTGMVASAVSIPEAMKQKNIDTIRTLITVAQTDGNYLGRAWLEILRCISQLESAHLITQQGTGPSTIGPLGGHHGLLTRAASLASSHLNAPSLNGTQPRRGTMPHSPSSSTVSLSSLSANSGVSVPQTELVAPGSLAAASVDPRKAAVLQEVMGETGSHSVIVAVDKIFTGSIRLNGDAIVDFVKALCQVSREELMLPHPRTFSLQKVVEISYYNMGRIRLQWSRVWEHIGGHFTAAGQSSNEDVAEFVLDSLRQLSTKFIEKGELPNFNFQKEFLRPFVSILDSGTCLTHKIQDMVIRCVSQLVHSQYMNIRSGWTNIFAALHHAASDSDESIVDMAFQTCAFVVSEVLNHHIHVALDAFQTFVKLLADFACNPHYPDTAMESIRLLRDCAQLVSQHSDTFATLASSDSVSTPGGFKEERLAQIGETGHSGDADTDQIWLKGYMPILCELFRVVNSCKLDVRTRGLTVFFDIIKSYGDQFKAVWWRDTFTIIFRVFQHFRSAPVSATVIGRRSPGSNSLSSMEQTEWMNTTCNHTLFSIVDVFTQFYEPLSNLLLDDIYTQLRWCCLQEHEQLARSGTSCLETLILSTGKRFTHEIWERTVKLIVELFESSVPHQLLTWRPDSVWDTNQSSPPVQTSNDGSPPVPRYFVQARLFADLLIKCVVQYEMIQVVDHILFYSSHSRHEDAHYLAETRTLAAASYPAYSAALAASSVRTTSSQNGDQSPIEITWTPDSFSDNGADTTDSKPETLWLGPGGTRVTVGARPLPADPRGMYFNLSPQQRLTLARCLLQSHTFAKQFNSNDEQRNVLFEAGFKVKAKPNLLKQETHSLLCSLRILFKLAEEETEVRDETEELLDRVIVDALTYYHGLLIDGHRQAWDTCLILIMTQLTRLSPATRFHCHATRLYSCVCDLVAMAVGVSPEVAALVRLFLLRCGAFFLPPTSRCDSLA